MTGKRICQYAIYIFISRYRYEMSNCLFEAAFEKILEDCKCAPGFHNEGGADAMDVS